MSNNEEKSPSCDAHLRIELERAQQKSANIIKQSGELAKLLDCLVKQIAEFVGINEKAKERKKIEEEGTPPPESVP